MRVEQRKIYELSELSESAQEKAHENYLNDRNFEYGWTSENKDTLYAFENIFPVKITSWEYDSNSANVSFEMTCDDDISALSGIRLAKYIWNNYKRDLFKGKFIGALSTNEKVYHKRIRSSEPYTNGNRSNHYYSAITLESNCVLTGYCLDDDILQPIYDFLNKPDSTDFETLIENCFEAWCKAVKNECQSQLSFEYFKDIAEANEYEFDEFGARI